MKYVLSLAMFLIAPLTLLNAADTKLAAVFCDHAILQRDQDVPIWGLSDSGARVTVEFAGQTKTAVADVMGRWLVKLDPMPASAEPRELKTSGQVVHDILVGDVWLCSGQSNMEFGMGKTENARQEIVNAKHPEIRLFIVGKATALHPVDSFKGKWLPCSPETVAQGGWEGFSAVAYFFGRELQQNLNVPIGLIQTAWGGTPAEAWTSREALAKISPDFDAALMSLARVNQMVETGTFNRQKLLDDWYAQNEINPAISTPGFAAAGWKTMHKLPHLWSAHDDPALADFRGVVWFRKEIDLPPDMASKEAVINFGCLDDGDVTWVNGTKVGAAMNLASRKYKVPAGLLKPGRNVIATWLLNTEGPGGIAGKPDELSLNVVGSPPISLSGDWQYKVLVPIDKMPPRVFEIHNNAGWPTELYNAMIAPLTPFGIKGAIWYQGEANVGRACQYRKLLPAMITDWRAHWQQGDFPFLIVQLANFGPAPGARPVDSAMAELREAQALAAKTLPNVSLITAVDIGEPGDIHPKNKQEVGRRLALVARAQVYRQAIPFTGPLYKLSKAEGSTLRIVFDHSEGLHAKGDQKLKGFAVAGVDRIFHWADARLDGNDVLLTSPNVPVPVAARYDWDANPDGNLYNSADLPTFPFRTDDWPGVTVNNK